MPVSHIPMDQASRSPTESRERAVSSEPCSTRPNPFDDDGSSARKRRRTSLKGASPSRSVASVKSSYDTPSGSAGDDIQGQPAQQDIGMTMDSVPSAPQTPERHQDPAEPVSESRPTKITLNLKNRKHPPQPVPSSPTSSKDVDIRLPETQENGIRDSVEGSELDVSHASSYFAVSESSPLDIDNPPIEIVDDDEESQNGEAQITIIQDSDPVAAFPYQAPGISLAESMQKLCQILTNHGDAAPMLRGWIENYLAWARGVDAMTLCQHYMQYRDFWKELPLHIWQYSSPTKPVVARSPQLYRLFSAMHTSYAKLTAFFVDLDVNLLSLSGDAENVYQESPSALYLMYLHQLLMEHGSQVPNMNMMDVDSLWPDSLNLILEGYRSFRPISDSQTSFHSLYQLGTSVAGLLPRVPRLVDNLHWITVVAAYLARDNIARLQVSSHVREVEEANSILADGYRLYETISDALTACIGKNVNQISTEAAPGLIDGLTSLLRTCLRAACGQAADVMKQHQRSHSDISQAFLVEVIVDEWRLMTLTKLVMSSQMQLRLQAAASLCQDLVRIFREHNDQVIDPSQQPVLRHFSTKLLQSGVVAYILGPTCHPEVTIQSGNIVGFLIASRTFTEDHLDSMWQTVTTCQISGVSENLLLMFTGIAHLFTSNHLLSVCRKLQSVPIEAFGPSMKDLCAAVMTNLTLKNDGLQELLPYSLMFRLLRESSAPGPQFYQVVQKWASNTIPQLLRYGPSHEDRSLLYQECLRDLTQKTRYTLGSLHGLSLLCRPVSRDRDFQLLTTRYDFPKLLVEELEHAISSKQDAGISHVISGPENAPRLELLTNVMVLEPGALTGDLGSRLWECLVGARAASQQDRDCAWQSLSSALKAHGENEFLKTCLDEYFPTLSPELFCHGALEFVLKKILPLVNCQNNIILDHDDESSEHPAIEQLWRIALTAPSGTIERRAIALLVKDIYVDSQWILSLPVHRARKMHLALVDRCMRQLSSAAEQLKAGIQATTNRNSDLMAVTVDEHVISEKELPFTRPLAIVREFHKCHQQTAHFSTPDMRSLVLPENNDVQGDSAELKVQSFDGNMQTEVKPLTIGRRNTAGSLLASIRDATGFDNYRMYYKGRAFTPSEQDICRSLEDLKIHNGLILVKRESDTVEYPVHVRPGASPVEIEIMRHFEELWQYLGLEENLASEIYAFLNSLPVDDRILNTLEQETITYREIFPAGQPLKSLYALYAIREYLNAQCCLAKSRPESGLYDRALRRALDLVVSAISDPEIVDKGSGLELKTILAARLVEQLLAILRDSSRPPSTPERLDHTLVERLLEILSSSMKTEPTACSTSLLNTTFRAILDTCSLNAEVWDSFRSQVDVKALVQKLLLDDAREAVRKSTATVIGEKSTHTLSPSSVHSTAFRDFFWPILIDLIPHALMRPNTCSEAFNLAVLLCKSARQSKPAVLDLNKTVRWLSELLLDHNPCESGALALTLPRRLPSDLNSTQDITQPGVIDSAAYGLVYLLHCILCDSVDVIDSEMLPASFCTELFWRHLFPRRWAGSDLLWQGGLIYNETTRFRLNDIILKVAGRDLVQLKRLLQDLDSLVPCATNDQTDQCSPYRYELPFNFERSRAIRSPCGYAGLKNLSNTCYLNSLCTQLFMNYDFRQFMLNVDIEPTSDAQALLYHTQSMFAQLQSSHRRFVDPEPFVSGIKTYDDELINIHNQMDVEEFFNLLNDRWEGQLRSQEAVRQFRSFYGGQLVTQTKSKECEHISEVMEPFSAIQCDIKGKKDLFESLEAYVDGEHMEGDNKYKCSTCDRHVDAVRRSCLKEIPDSLIFHLKRFDFNLRTQARSKINDYFAFPDRIDMRPYTIERLSNSPGGSTEDWFELVGVLVHAGTAESGHYYSFIRERPTTRGNNNWFEFNDDIVTPWNPSRKEAACYGGSESSWETGGISYEKNYCAYMLFYERSSALERKQQDLQQSDYSSPVQSKMPEALAHSIRVDNLRLLQRHCLFDPDHIRLLDTALERMLDLNRGECSKDHEVETLAVMAAIGHLDQVASRVKDVPDAPKLTERIKDMADNCAHCALVVYEYFSNRHESFRNLIQRNPEPQVRRSAADILILALESTMDDLPDNYGRQPTSQSTLGNSSERIIYGVCDIFETLWTSFHTQFKSWLEVFDLMARFVDLGKQELLAFLGRSFLVNVMLIFMAENLPDLDQQFTKLGIALGRRQSRPPCYMSIIDLLSKILASITVSDPVETCVEREKAFIKHPDDPIPITEHELSFLQKEWEQGGNILFDKLILISQNTEATDDIFAHILQQRWPLERDVLTTLLVNTIPQTSFVVHAPYLRVAALYCRFSYEAGNIDALIRHIATQSKVLANSEPKAILQFFVETMDGTRQNSGESRIAIHKQCLEYLPTWAPGLLAHYDPHVILRVENILHDKVFRYGVEPEFEDEYGGVERAEATVGCAKVLGLELCTYVRSNYIRRGNSVQSQTVAVVTRVLDQCGNYFDEEDMTPGSAHQRFFIMRQAVLDDLRRLSVDDLEEDGSGMSDGGSFFSDSSLPEYRELTPLAVQEWENSVASSDQMDSLGDDDVKEMEL